MDNTHAKMWLIVFNIWILTAQPSHKSRDWWCKMSLRVHFTARWQTILYGEADWELVLEYVLEKGSHVFSGMYYKFSLPALDTGQQKS